MSKDDFFGRWSKRKLAGEPEKAGVEETVVPQEPAPAALDKIQASEIDTADQIEDETGEGGEEHEPHPAEGIDIEELEYESDFTVFMNDKVPETLRRLALRKLWRSSPILANVDGLNDYDEDFSDATAVFINSTGKVISGTRDQFRDHKQVSENTARPEKEGRQPAGQEDAGKPGSEHSEKADGDSEDAEKPDEVHIAAQDNEIAIEPEENTGDDAQENEEDTTGIKT